MRRLTPDRFETSRKRRRALFAGGAALLVLALALVLTLQIRYCLFCSDAERVEKAARLLCDRADPDLERGLYLLEQAAANGYPEALALRGELSLEGLPERYVPSRPALLECAQHLVATDDARARATFQRLAASAQAGPQALYNLGILLESGYLTGAEVKGSAADFFARSAESGSSLGIFALGRQAHLRGDYQQAAEKFRAAYAQGDHPEAALLLGDYHLYGHGVKRSRDEALEWYRKALEGARKPAFAGMIGQLERAAEQRLQLASGPGAEAAESEPTVVAYRLEGRPDQYRVFLADRQIGRVASADGMAHARFEGETTSEEARFATMNEGLDWILQTYAAETLGTEQRVRFRLKTP